MFWTFRRPAAGLAAALAVAACVGPAPRPQPSSTASPPNASRAAAASAKEPEIASLLRELARMRAQRDRALAQLRAALRGEQALEAELAKTPQPSSSLRPGSRTQVFTTLTTAPTP